MPQGVYTWAKVAASNSNADSSIGWAEGQPPSSVNDSARAMMARLAEFRDDAAGSITTTGTSTAYAAATNQVFASLALMDKKSITIVPHVTSGVSPTLAVDGLAPKPLRCATGAALAAPGGTFVAGTPYTVTYFNTAGEFLCDGAGIADGAISTNNLAAGAVTGAKIAANTITAGNMAPGAIGAASVAPSFIPVNTVMLNGTIVVAVGGGQMTINVKTLAGADPSAADPTTFIFRDVTLATGDYVVRTVTGALTLVVPLGQILGFLSNVPGRLWVLAVDSGAGVVLAVFNAAGLVAGTPVTVSNIFPLQTSGIITTQAIAAAPSAGVAYSTAVQSAKPYVPIGYLSWEVGGLMSTAGNWSASPSRVQIFQPGSSPLPGAIVQQAYFSTGAVSQKPGTVATPTAASDTIPTSSMGDQVMQLAITPSSSANALIVNATAHCSTAAGGNPMTTALFQDAIANAVAVSFNSIVAVSTIVKSHIDYQLQAGTLGTTTFKINIGNQTTGQNTINGIGATRAMGGALNSGMRITELMA